MYQTLTRVKKEKEKKPNNKTKSMFYMHTSTANNQYGFLFSTTTMFKYSKTDNTPQ